MTQNLIQNQPVTRSTNGVLAGVCAGIAERFDVPAWAVRVLWLLFVLAWGTGIAFYLVCFICIPRSDRAAEAQKPKLLGVCFRLSRALAIDVSIIRVIAVFAALGSLGTFLLVYVILHFVIPKETSGIINVQ